MLDIKWTGLLDFLAWLRGQYPEPPKSLGEEELFVPYTKPCDSETEKLETLKNDLPTPPSEKGSA